SIADELLRDLRHRRTLSLRSLFGRIRRAKPYTPEDCGRPISDSSREIAAGIAIERAAGWIGSVAGDAGELERLAVVKAGVAAAVMNGDRQVARDCIQIVHVQRARVFDLRVIKEVALHPMSRRGCVGPRAQLVDNPGDCDELNLEGITHGGFVEQVEPDRMVVTVDEPRHDGHLLGIKDLGALADESANLRIAPHCDESPGTHGTGLSAGCGRLDGVDAGIYNHGLRRLRRLRHVRRVRRGTRGTLRPQPTRPDAQKTRSGRPDHLATIDPAMAHGRHPDRLLWRHETSRAATPARTGRTISLFI